MTWINPDLIPNKISIIYNKKDFKPNYIKKRAILVGKGGSGKDHLKNILVGMGFRYSVSHTTRPIRSNEIDGSDYHFVSEEKFLEMIDKDLFFEQLVFNGWYYGTSREEFSNSNLFIMTPGGLSKLSHDERDESFVIYLDIDSDIRKNRMCMRKDADDVERRLKADEIDFNLFDDYDATIIDPNFKGDSLMDYLIIRDENKYNI